jgi:hypothetical protein
LREREASESEELITGFLETLIDRLAAQLPLAGETSRACSTASRPSA